MAKKSTTSLQSTVLLLFAALLPIAASADAGEAPAPTTFAHAPSEEELSSSARLSSGCRIVQLDKIGQWAIQLRTSSPSTSPSLLVMHSDRLVTPPVVTRLELTQLHIAEPGAHLVCSTSQMPLDDLQLKARFMGAAEKSDPLEVEVEEDPLVTCEPGINDGETSSTSGGQSIP